MVDVECGISPADVIPRDQRFYTYAGSLTTPPCFETVQWIVYKCPVRVSKKVKLARIFCVNPPRDKDEFNGMLHKSTIFSNISKVFLPQALKRLQEVEDSHQDPLKKLGVRRPIQVKPI
jgi:hypothetical protein